MQQPIERAGAQNDERPNLLGVSSLDWRAFDLRPNGHRNRAYDRFSFQSRRANFAIRFDRQFVGSGRNLDLESHRLGAVVGYEEPTLRNEAHARERLALILKSKWNSKARNRDRRQLHHQPRHEHKQR